MTERPIEEVTTVGETDAHGFFRLAEPVFARIAKNSQPVPAT